MAVLVKKLISFFTVDLWRIETGSLTSFKSMLVSILRLIYVTVREFHQNELTLRSMSLVYTTLISLVPLLAFSISILKAFGIVENQLEPFLVNFLEPLGEKGVEITQTIMQFIGNINFGVLGIIGLLMLIYTSISVIMKIEDSLNTVWKINKGRSLARRFSDYISTLLIGPVLMFVALGLTASFENNALANRILSIEPLGTIVYIIGILVPYLLVIMVFTFIYIILPNTKVKFKSALIGGVIAGLAWHTTSWIFAISVASSARYAAIYSSLALLIIFMIWLYLNWLIMLIGAQISFCHQNLRFLTLENEVFNLSTKLKEKLSLIVMYIIGLTFYNNEQRWTLESLTEHLKLPQDPVGNAVADLKNSNLIIETADEPPYLVPSRDTGTITLREILDSTRMNYETDTVEKKYLSFPEVNSITQNMENAIYEALGEETLRDIILKSDKPDL